MLKTHLLLLLLLLLLLFSSCKQRYAYRVASFTQAVLSNLLMCHLDLWQQLEK